MSDESVRLDLLAMLDAAADMVATWTGVKAQFVGAGWNERAAELMTIEILRAAVASTTGAAK